MDHNVFMDHDGVVEKERGQYPAILTEQAWSIKDLLHGKRTLFVLQDTAGNPEPARWGYLARSGSTGFGSSCLFTELSM